MVPLRRVRWKPSLRLVRACDPVFAGGYARACGTVTPRVGEAACEDGGGALDRRGWNHRRLAEAPLRGEACDRDGHAMVLLDDQV